MKIFLKTLSVGIIFLSFINGIQAQDANKTVTLTVNGTGITKELATQNALRSAIEQAFGVYVSSNTQILNDKLVKDEIVAASSGNIEEYNLISEVQTTGGNWLCTIKAKVSIDKLISFCESKGVMAELKGASFAQNIKIQRLNKINEEKVIGNMNSVAKNMLEKAFDYSVNIKDPYADGGIYIIPIQIVFTVNQNFISCEEYIVKTLKSISLSKIDAENIEKGGENAYRFEYGMLNSNEILQFYFRSPTSVLKIYDVFLYLRKSKLNFKISSEVFSIKGTDLSEWEETPGYASKFQGIPGNGISSILMGGTLLSGFRLDGDKIGIQKYVPFEEYLKNKLYIDTDAIDFMYGYNPSRSKLKEFFKIRFNDIQGAAFDFVFNYPTTESEISKITSIKITPEYSPLPEKPSKPLLSNGQRNHYYPILIQANH